MPTIPCERLALLQQTRLPGVMIALGADVFVAADPASAGLTRFGITAATGQGDGWVPCHPGDATAGAGKRSGHVGPAHRGRRPRGGCSGNTVWAHDAFLHFWF